MSIENIRSAFEQAASEELPSRVVPVPSLGIEVKVVGMNGADRSRFREYVKKQGDQTESHIPKILSLTVCDLETGKPIYPDKNGEEFMRLGPKYQGDLVKLTEVAYELSFLSDDESEELEKN